MYDGIMVKPCSLLFRRSFKSGLQEKSLPVFCLLTVLHKGLVLILVSKGALVNAGDDVL